MLAKKLQKKFPSLISDVRGWGLILGIEIAETNAFGAPEVRMLGMLGLFIIED